MENICEICRLDPTCQHNYDYECIELFHFIEGKKWGEPTEEEREEIEGECPTYFTEREGA